MASARYREAVAELPLSVRLDPAGQIIVVNGGAGWLERLLAVSRRGRIVILVEPDVVGADALEQAVADVQGPVIVERSRRERVPERARAVAARANAVVVEMSLPARDRAVWLRDALGWAREMAGGDASVAAVEHSSTGVVALLRGSRSIPVSLLASDSAGPPLLELRTLGEERLELRVGNRRRTLRISSAGGETQLPESHESPARATLRRAIAAATGDCDSNDLAELVLDERLRAALTSR